MFRIEKVDENNKQRVIGFLEVAEKAALFVRSNNYPAIRVYEKIGYRKISEKIWLMLEQG